MCARVSNELVYLPALSHYSVIRLKKLASVEFVTCARHFKIKIKAPQIPICSLFRLFALHLAPAASALQLLKSGTHSLQLFECVPAIDIFVVISRLTISSRSGLPVRLAPSFLRLTFDFCLPDRTTLINALLF